MNRIIPAGRMIRMMRMAVGGTTAKGKAERIGARWLYQTACSQFFRIMLSFVIKVFWSIAACAVISRSKGSRLTFEKRSSHEGFIKGPL